MNSARPKPSRGRDQPAARRPLELYDRAAGYAGLWAERYFTRPPDYEAVNWETARRDLEQRLGAVSDVLEEPALREVEDDTRRLLQDIRGHDPFRPRWAADSLLARCCYVVCRLLQPDVVIETGVAYGVSSAFILTALRENGRGALHSVDLPPLTRRYGEFWGIAVNRTLEPRWNVYRGSSKRVLPGLLRRVDAIDLFLHDSLHTRRNMRREFEAVWPNLRDGGVLLADDVERNSAFGKLRRKNPELWCLVRDRQERPLHSKAASKATFGVVVK